MLTKLPSKNLYVIISKDLILDAESEIVRQGHLRYHDIHQDLPGNNIDPREDVPDILKFLASSKDNK